MQVSKWLCFAASWMLVATQDIYDDNPNPETQNYQFRYYVRDESTGDIKSQEETKQGSTVNGHYSVGEPTGDRRVVTYTADEGGFRADVKYEEGGSPASEDKARQTNAKSGVEFQWLPANPDDIQEGKSGSEETNKEDTSSEVSSESNQSGTERTTTNMSDEPSDSNSEATTESTSTTETISESSTTEVFDIQSEIEKISKESDSSSETSSTESSSEPSNNISETPEFTSDSSVESTMASTESAVENSLETSTSSSIEGKNTIQTDEDNTSENEQSAEAAESAPLSEEVLPPLQPSQMYLPVISYQNLPFLNLPMLDNTPEKPPTIIYASQNFYNPWQWFGNSRRVARDVQHIRTIAKEYQHPFISRHHK